MNGQPSTSVKLADALLGVKLPADTEICKIELRYVPHTFYIGLAVSGSALLFFLFWYMIFRKKQSGSHMTKVTCSSVALSDKAKYRRIRL